MSESQDLSRAALVDVLTEFARTLLDDYAVDDVLERLTARVPDVLPVKGAGVMLEDTSGHLRFAGATDETLRHVETLQIELDEGPCVAAYRTGEQVLLDDLTAAPQFPAFAPRALAQGLAAVYSFPMWHAGTGLGALDLYRESPAVLTPAQLAAGQTLADVVTAYLLDARSRERSRLAEEELHWRSVTDPLTGLPNRRLLVDHLGLALSRSRRNGRCVGLLFLDLDRFKAVNDSLGHSAGDELLVEVAARLRRAVRPSDTPARLGGDEFAVVCEDLRGPGDALAVAERILSALEAPVTVQGRRLVVTPSIGVATGSGADGPAVGDPDALLAHADAAMYRAKESGRARVELFDSGMQRQALERRELEAALALALPHGQLRLEYQPLVDVATGRVVGAEALLRWQHPERGLLPPAEFLACAEESGLLVPIGRWVLAEACRQAAGWQRACALPPGFQLSVNLSAAELRDPLLLDALADVLQESRLPPDTLCLEITERTLVLDTEAPVSALHALKTLGACVAVDDFGTGHSSLSSLTRFPVDALKVDRSFVAGLGVEPQATRIVEAVVRLAHAMGLPAIAEGVETDAQLRRLQQLGCDRAQGFLFSRAGSAQDVAHLLRSAVEQVPA